MVQFPRRLLCLPFIFLFVIIDNVISEGPSLSRHRRSTYGEDGSQGLGTWWLTYDIIGGSLTVLITVLFITGVLLYVYFGCCKCRCSEHDTEAYRQPDDKYMPERAPDTMDTWDKEENLYEVVTNPQRDRDEGGGNSNQIMSWYAGRSASHNSMTSKIAKPEARVKNPDDVKTWYQDVSSMDGLDETPAESQSLLKNSAETHGTKRILRPPMGTMDRHRQYGEEEGARPAREQTVWTTRGGQTNVNASPKTTGQMVLTRNATGQMIWTAYRYLRTDEPQQDRQTDTKSANGTSPWYDGIQGENNLESTL